MMLWLGTEGTDKIDTKFGRDSTPIVGSTHMQGYIILDGLLW
jgi:hypothetical protein